MSKAAKYTDQVVTELAAIEALAKNRDGPIADTYDRLQGIIFLQAAEPRKSLGDVARVYTSLHQSKSLIFFNIAHLLSLARHQLATGAPNSMEQIAGDLRWCASLMQLACEISAAATPLFARLNPTILSRGKTQAEVELIAALESFDLVLDAYQRDNRDSVAAAIGRRYLLSGAASALHSFKVSYHLLGATLAVGMPPPKAHLLAEPMLRLAVHSLNTRRATYLMQFRLLHQIPEVLGAITHDIMKSIQDDIRIGRDADATDRLSLIYISLNQAVNCLWPLIYLLLPSHYYQIRRHLGVTSGSNSDVLSRGVLTSGYFGLAEVAKSRLDKGDLPADLLNAFLGVRQQIVLWREVHLFLPWSILGTQATSLIGSKNAPDVVKAMRTAFDEKDPFGMYCRAAPHDALPSQAIEQLLEITGGVTRRRFRDVEDRTGRYARKGK